MRYSGVIGYATTVETSPGVFEDVITERKYRGDVSQRTETFSSDDTIHATYRQTISVSVLSDGVLKKLYNDIRYVSYGDELWTVSSISMSYPRITLFLGEVYNGPRPTPTP